MCGRVQDDCHLQSGRQLVCVCVALPRCCGCLVELWSARDVSDHGCIPTLLFDGAVQPSLDRGRPERTLHLMGCASPGSWQLHYPGTLNLALLKLLPLSFEKHFIACANNVQPSHGASCFTAYGLLPRFGIRDHILEACWVGKTSPSWSPRQCCSSTYCNCTNPWPQTWPSVVRRFHQICPPWWVLAFVRDCPGAVGLWVRGAVRIGQSRALRERCLLPSSFVHEMSGIHAGVNKPVASVPLEPVHHQYSQAILLSNNPCCRQCNNRQELHGRVSCRTSAA